MVSLRVIYLLRFEKLQEYFLKSNIENFKIWIKLNFTIKCANFAIEPEKH